LGADASTSSEALPTAGLAAAKTFADLPLSAATQSGLLHAKYKNLTAIQRASIAHALAGRDILGAAKTGSGKTLAFLIPVILLAVDALCKAHHCLRCGVYMQQVV
jgi:ATP-dependent RNA helicase DDX10/DBP4